MQIQRQHGIIAIVICVAFFLTGQLCSAANFNLTVTVPANTPENETIYITGNHDLLANWAGKGVALKEIGPGLHSFAASLPPESTVEFKFTRGSFSTVEKTAQGLEVPNRKITIKAGEQINLKINVEAWADQIGSQNPGNKPVITGEYRIIRNLTSKFLANKRDVIVWLPTSYLNPESSKKRYPVIYMHDGGNLFDPTTSFGGIDWGIDETMTEGISNGSLREAIIVGIGNTSERMSEYTPFPDPKHKGGNGENYAKFLVEELKPMIDKDYRTHSNRANTFVGGSSLGGLISLYIGISRPEVFSGIIAMSPSIWWADGKIINWLIQNNLAGWNGKIWMDMGTREGEEGIGFTRKLAEAVKYNAPAFKGLNYKEFSGGTHSESAWNQRMHLPLKFFLPAE